MTEAAPVPAAGDEPSQPARAPVPWLALAGAVPVVAVVVLLLAGSSSAAGLVAAVLVELGVVAIVYRWSGTR